MDTDLRHSELVPVTPMHTETRNKHVANMTQRLMACAGADRGYLLLMKNKKLGAVSFAVRSDDGVDVTVATALQDIASAWPRNFVDGVAQQKTTQVLWHDGRPEQYDIDGYFTPNNRPHCIGIPLLSGDDVIGVAYLERSPQRSRFLPEQLFPLELLAEQMAEAVVLEDTLLSESNLLRLVIDAIPDLVFVKDTQGRFVVVNAAIIKAFGVSAPEDLIGKSDFDFYAAENVIAIYESEQQIIRSATPSVDQEEFNPNLGGVPRWFSTTKVPVKNLQGQVTGLVGACREVTERKLYELDLERRNNELAELNSKLVLAQDQLFKAEKMAALGALVAGVAHELNTPIGIGMTVASTLSAQTHEFWQHFQNGSVRRSQLEKYVESARNGTELMLRSLTSAGELVHSFKQVAVDQSSSHRREFQLRQTVEEIVVLLSPWFKGNSYSLSVDIDESIKLDSFPGPLGQVINNLVSNALNHGFRDRSVGTMRLHALPLSADGVEITFEDDGVGIPADVLPRVFEPFFTTRLGQGGSGLGMSVVYNIVTSILGGSVHLESQPGQGTKVRMRLPVVAPELGKPK